MDHRTLTIIADSAEAAGASNVTADGSHFEIALEEPIEVPAEATHCTAEVQEATVWWTTPNLSAALGNNMFHIVHAAATHDLIIPDGLYSVETLSSALEREVVEATGVAGLFTLEGDGPTQKVNIGFSIAGLRMDFNPGDTPRLLLGFDSRFVPAAGITTGEAHELGDSPAAFNMVDYFLIHSDIVNKGMRNDGTYWRTIAKVDIDVHPGSQIIHRPFNPVVMDAKRLIGASVDVIRFWLTDQLNMPTDTNNEDWSVTVVVRYTIPPPARRGSPMRMMRMR